MLCVGVGAPQQTHFLPEPSGFATSNGAFLSEEARPFHTSRVSKRLASVRSAARPSPLSWSIGNQPARRTRKPASRSGCSTSSANSWSAPSIPMPMPDARSGAGLWCAEEKRQNRLRCAFHSDDGSSCLVAASPKVTPRQTTKNKPRVVSFSARRCRRDVAAPGRARRDHQGQDHLPVVLRRWFKSQYHREEALSSR